MEHRKMAKAKGSTGPRNPEQVTREVERGGVRYIGTREALIAAGHVCADTAFPGPCTDARARRVRHEGTDPSGHKIRIRKHGRHRFDVLCKREHTELEAAELKRIEAEQAAWWEEDKARWERQKIEQQEKDRREAREREQAEARAMYATADEFRQGQALLAGAVPQVVITDMSSGTYGWRLCDEDRDRLLGLKAAACRCDPERARCPRRRGRETAPSTREGVNYQCDPITSYAMSSSGSRNG
jgi:hypothetical protein